MSDKSVPDVDDGFGVRAPACREYTLPREDQSSRFYATIPGQTIIGPLLQAHIIRYLGISRTDFRIPSTTTKYLNLLGGGMPRDKPLRGRVTSQWSRPQSHKFWISFGKICYKTKRTWFYKDGAIEHRGNSCEAVRNSDESSVQLLRIRYSCWRKEVERHSCLSTTQRKYFRSPSLKVGHEVGTSLWSTWKRSRRRCSLEIDGSKTAKSVSKGWRATILGRWLASASLQRKQQNSVPVLQEFQRRLIVHSRCSRTHWWELDGAWVDGSCRNSVQVERIPVFIEDAVMMALQSSNQDPSLGER